MFPGTHDKSGGNRGRYINIIGVGVLPDAIGDVCHGECLRCLQCRL
jgi:hypothetical protein